MERGERKQAKRASALVFGTLFLVAYLLTAYPGNWLFVFVSAGVGAVVGYVATPLFSALWWVLSEAVYALWLLLAELISQVSRVIVVLIIVVILWVLYKTPVW